MEDAVFDSNDVERPSPEDTKVASLYAAAAARIVVTSKRSFTTACGAQRLAGEVMTLGYVQPNEAAALEASIEGLIDHASEIDATHRWSTTQAVGAIFDPDVLLAWLLSEGVTARH